MNTSSLEDIYPLTPVQRGMLFHSLQTAPSTGVYLQQIEIRFRGTLDAGRLRHAWEAVVARHAPLRTLFVWDEKKPPVQAVCRQFSIPWREHDWTQMNDVEEHLRTFLRQDRVAGFDLSTAPPLRCSLFHTRQGAILIWTFHHLALDGWSMAMVLKEMLAHYAAVCEGRTLHLPATPPFRDFIVWLRNRDQAGGLDFWKSQLADFLGNPPFPMEVEPGQPEEYAECETAISPEATILLNQMARRERVTLGACVQTAWSLILSRYCSSDDIIFGVTHAGRPTDLPGADSMIGMFLNTVPVRVRVRPQDTIRDILRDIFDGQARREENSWTPLPAIQRASERSGERLFDSLVVFENYPIPAVPMPPGLEVESVRGYDRTNYPLTLLVMPGTRLTLRLAWQTERYSPGAIERLLGHFATLLEAMPSSLNLPARRAPVLPEVERMEIRRCNATQRDYGAGCTLLDILEEQALATPEATAVSFGGQSLTYRQLHERADRLAWHLATLGAAPETVVAVEIERSLDLIVALLGIVKCGAAWLPLDSGDPLTRRQWMARKAGAFAVLVRSTQDEHACERVVALDSLASSSPSAVRRPLPSSLAYVIFTSGSSGTPKGVMNTHEGLVNRLLWMQQRFQLTAEDVVLQKTSATFDVSVWEFFWPLIVGARLALAGPGEHRDVEALARTIERECVTTVHFVPSMLRVFLEYAQNACASLKRVICSGEALLPDIARQFHDRFRAELHNLYGPTEAAIDVTHHACARGEATTPIGRPVANTQTWIMDEQLALLPIGIPGELFLGGIQVARGYIENPALTAERFLPDPFQPGTGARLYRTGDRARLLPGGEIQYLGRIDFQLKIRGIRVEPGEIEVHLESHPSVDRAAVIGYPGPEGNRLAACIVGRDGALPNEAELRTWLRRSLPEPMVPSVFITLDSLPHTASGKTDRKALAAAHSLKAMREEPSAGGREAQSRSTTEREVTTIWEETLQRSGIGVRDNFFDVGGNSLLLVPIHRKLVDRFGIALRITDLFRFPTIESLSTLLSYSTVAAPQTIPELRTIGGLEAQRALRRQARGA